MGRDSVRKVLFAFFAFFVLAGAAHAQPMLVMQPAYGGMSFYVHQPQGIPANWFATFDGYPVWKGAEGVWFYGSYANNVVVPTDYVVGSIVPSSVGIVPYMTAAGVIAAPAAPAVAVLPWVCAGGSFMELGSWRNGVDRVGILSKPSIPIAWRGTRPNMIYAWTGNQWYQLIVGENERPGDVLRDNLYLLTRLVHQNGNPIWQTSDVGFLIAQTARWGYVWMGELGPNPNRVY